MGRYVLCTTVSVCKAYIHIALSIFLLLFMIGHSMIERYAHQIQSKYILY